MPRPVRQPLGGDCYHVLNRGNAQATVFHKDADFHAFTNLIAQAGDRFSMRLLGLCLMPNHFHLVVWPREDGDLARYMQWLTTSHVRRYHRHYGGTGHVWQGRYKSFPVQTNRHFYTLLRYVERNPLRANLVSDATQWPWSSIGDSFLRNYPSLLAEWPLDRPADWREYVNRPESQEELEALRRSVERGAPYGEAVWVATTAQRLGLGSAIHPRGRPRGKGCGKGGQATFPTAEK